MHTKPGKLAEKQRTGDVEGVEPRGSNGVTLVPTLGACGAHGESEPPSYVPLGPRDGSPHWSIPLSWLHEGSVPGAPAPGTLSLQQHVAKRLQGQKKFLRKEMQEDRSRTSG